MTRKKYIQATIKLMVGLILLTASFSYLQHHPAEKLSLVSGIEVLYHRGVGIWYRIIGRNTEALEQRYNMNRYIRELEFTLSNNDNCLSTDIDQRIDRVRETIYDASDQVFLQQSTTYRSRIRQIEQAIRNDCV